MKKTHHLFDVILLAVGLLVSAGTASAQSLYFPGEEWERIAPADVGWDQQKLTTAIDYAISQNSSGVVVLYGGKMMAERYQRIERPTLRYKTMLLGTTVDGRSIEDVASVQKSVTSILVGIAIEKELVKLTDPATQHLGLGWSAAKPSQERPIELKHLISMNSGLDSRLRFRTKPNTVWKYNTRAYSKSLGVIAAASKFSPNEFTRNWLTSPLGMKETKWVRRSFVRDDTVDANTWGLATTARDLARFGLLIQAQGQWNGKPILADREYLRSALSPSQDQKPQYGYLFWLNQHDDLIPSAPNDLVAGLGALGRKCYVVPSLNLVVTRLGGSPKEKGKRAFDQQFWRLLMKAAPR